MSACDGQAYDLRDEIAWRDRLATMRTTLVAGARTCVHTGYPEGTWRYHWRADNGPRFDSTEWIEYVPEVKR